MVTNGLQEILFGDTAVDGDAGTVLATLGYTNEDSGQFAQEDPTQTDFNVEELDDPIHTNVKAGKTTFTWVIANPVLETFEKVFGGTITGTGTEEDPKVWGAPDKIKPVYGTLKIVPETGLEFMLMPRVLLVPKFNTGVGRNSLFGLEISATVMKPIKTGVAKIQFAAVTTPTP